MVSDHGSTPLTGQALSKHATQWREVVAVVLAVMRLLYGSISNNTSNSMEASHTVDRCPTIRALAQVRA